MTQTLRFKDIFACLICALFFMYEFLLRTVMGTLQPNIMHDFHLNTIEFSILSTTSYQCIYGIMQILVGVIIERFGLKHSLFAAIFLCCITSLGFAWTDHFHIALACRLLMWLGSSFGFVCLLVTIYDRIPRHYIAMFIGVSQFIGTLGPMLAAGPLSAFAQNSTCNWRDIFYGLAVIAAILGIIVQFCFEKQRPNRTEMIFLVRPATMAEKLLHILKQPQIWLIAIFSGSTYFAIEYLSENEGIRFLVLKGMTPILSSYMISIAWFGYALGCPIFGFFSDKLERRKPFIVLCTVSNALALAGIIYLPAHQIVTSISFFLLGLGASGCTIGFAMAAEQSKEDNLALILGFNNMMIVVFMLISTLGLSHMLIYVASHTSFNLMHYQKAFSLTLLFILPAIVSSIYIKETFCKSRTMSTKLIINKPIGEDLLAL
jgi:MFS family permease